MKSSGKILLIFVLLRGSRALCRSEESIEKYTTTGYIHVFRDIFLGIYHFLEIELKIPPTKKAGTLIFDEKENIFLTSGKGSGKSVILGGYAKVTKGSNSYFFHSPSALLHLLFHMFEYAHRMVRYTKSSWLGMLFEELKIFTELALSYIPLLA